ncbi:MAG: hypothetical protein HN478_01840 [Rhodospirillaceae bacterium]|jgi:hypothetical protein|nr:hypothetical protein [Rhodospirillaceae bacterium]MBT4489231.1 hypothetical protein [Rhodospirillaceae bacterium]MBT5194232.1 hypothetical protein [Rhodospirillaceae bacterium]MBT5897650.1 hypothetical protein [Rhodospirillaceae bacterium]MBT6431098.1 hypothetical protein [Rhodospirillaceae bacterium]
MNIYRYPVKALIFDYIRSGLGVLVPIALMLFTDLLPVVFYILAGLVLLFGIYGVRTALRQATLLSVDGNGVRQEGPLGGLLNREIRWADLRDFRLRYYSTRRDGKGGWMQLVLRATDGSEGHGSNGPIRLDSNLPGFDDIVRQVYEMARDHGLANDPASAANLTAMGLGSDDPAVQPTVSSPAPPNDAALPS